jgi:hypothetical protein
MTEQPIEQIIPERQHGAAEARIGALEAALRDLIWAIAGEQEDPIELARALGSEAPAAIARARKALEAR